MQIHTELSGSRTAFVPTMNLTITAQKGSAIPTLARRLIELGASPEDTLHVLRGGTPVFAKDSTLSRWVDTTVRENDNTSVRFVKYQPLDRDVFA